MYGGPGGNMPNIDLEDLKKKAGGFARMALIGGAAILAIILVFNCFYTLDSGEQAVILRLGSHLQTEREPGLHFKLPFIDEVHKVSTERINILEFGYRDENPRVPAAVSDRESIMLTGDEDLIVATWVVQYQIEDPFLALFRIEDLEVTLRVLTESSYRRVVAANSLDAVLTDEKERIQGEVLRDLQFLNNRYGTGVRINMVLLQSALAPEPVQPAFLDVISARVDYDRRVFEARRYENERLPIARGEAERMINDAMGFRERRINEATGEISRYLAILAEYAQHQSIMRTRLYLEMVRDVFPHLESITIVNDNDDILKFLPIGGSVSEVLR
jgi:membrane protease subunit HflK